MTKLRVGIVGCGAIARQQHLPALIQNPRAEPAGLVDVDSKAAEWLNKLFRLDLSVLRDINQVSGWDAAIVCVPPHLHASISNQLLEKGIHVLCEKPVATSIEDGLTMIQRANSLGLIFSVVMQKFFYPSTGLLKAYLESGMLGNIRSIELECRQKSEWNAGNPERFSPTSTPGGVTFENGIHWLYRMAYWFGSAQASKYADNRVGGVESNALINGHYSLDGRPLPFEMKFSADHAGQNRLLIRTDDADVYVYDAQPDGIEFNFAVGPQKVVSVVQPAAISIEMSFGYKQVDHFLSLITGEESENPTPYSLEGLRFLLDCYSRREPLPEPWAI